MPRTSTRSDAFSSSVTNDRGRGYRHHHSDEDLRRYLALSPTQKLGWLHAAWKLTVDLLPPEARLAHDRFRRGDL